MLDQSREYVAYREKRWLALWLMWKAALFAMQNTHQKICHQTIQDQARLHEVFGPVFDLKQFYDECPKILNKFKKQIDPDLPFFYWTGAKQRYTEFDLPSFNKPTAPGIVERLDKVKISRRGDPGVFVANRASLP